MSFEYRAVTTKKSGAPIDIIFPTEGLGWDLEASGIMKTTKKLDAAKSLMDWLATPGAMELFAKNFAVVAIPGIAKPLEFVPADYERAAGEERLRVVGQESRQDHRRMDEALRRQVRAEVSDHATRARPARSAGRVVFQDDRPCRGSRATLRTPTTPHSCA